MPSMKNMMSKLGRKFTMRVDDDMLSALDLVCEDERLSRSDTIRRLIYEAADRVKRKRKREDRS